jgi:hypothetical protein
MLNKSLPTSFCPGIGGSIFAKMLPNSQKLLLTASIFSSTFLALFVSASVIYVSIYQAMPLAQYKVPFYLDYDQPRPASVSNINIPRNRYDLSIKLTVPETSSNRELGNFMVNVVMKGKAIKRPAHLEYKSPLLFWLRLLFRLPILMFTPESHEILVPIVNNVDIDRVQIGVELSKHVSTYSTVFVFDYQFTGLYYFMHNW